MLYSKNIMRTLLGSDLFDDFKTVYERRRFGISLEGNLDLFTALLFFFVFEEKRFRANRFLNFFCGIPKVTLLKNRKHLFWDTVEEGLKKLSEIKILGKPFLTYTRTKNLFRCEISKTAYFVKEFFVNEVRTEDFLSPKIKRAGIPVAYLGALIYFSGVLGKKKVDLNYLANQKIVQDFSDGYKVWKSASMVKRVAFQVFQRNSFAYEKDLVFQDFQDGILRIEKKHPVKEGLCFQKDVQKQTAAWHEKLLNAMENPFQPSWKYHVINRFEDKCHDFLFAKDALASQINFLNRMEMDIRLDGKKLNEKIYAEFGDSVLNRLVEFECPVSHISRSRWKDIELAGSPCAVIDLENIRTRYMMKQCKIRKLDFSRLPENQVLSKVPEEQKELVIEMTLHVIYKYLNRFKQRRQALRELLKKYFHIHASKKEVNSLFYFVEERCFHFSKGVPNFVSEDDFIRKCVLMYFGTLQRLDVFIPMIVTTNALIVPKNAVNAVLRALSDSYASIFGNRSKAKFKVTTKSEVRHFRFTNRLNLKEIKKEEKAA